jgi:hypothetical protein
MIGHGSGNTVPVLKEVMIIELRFPALAIPLKAYHPESLNQYSVL